ncbi:O-Antigen ligase [Microbulbifer aggregans]|uniref:O-Antigen ligase n=1 Tax=Microbulbifer aggregans TaxID=1769779 RepID=A0A1C9W7T5_9GAMM|nr:O-Antigen ligase [Microbulbifer aggregans]
MFFLAILFFLLCALSVIIYVHIGLKRSDLAFILTLYVVLLWPTYLNVKIGSLPNIGLDRIFVLLFLFTMLAKKFSGWKGYLKSADFPLALYALFGFWMILVGLLSPFSKVAATYAVVNWFFFGPFLAVSVISIFNGANGAHRLLLHLYIISLIVNILGLLEVFSGEPLFAELSALLGVNREGLVEGFYRDGRARVISVFSSPLVYAQFLLVTLCLSLMRYVESSGPFKLLAALNILLSYILLLKTGSRAGLAISLLLPIIFLYIKLWRINFALPLLKFGLFCLMSLLSLSVYWLYVTYISDARNLETLMAYGYVSTSEASSLARVLQWDLGLEAFKERPFLGYGEGQAGEAIISTIVLDNYYLTRLLSGGVLGLILFLMPILILVRYGFVALTNGEKRAIYPLSAVACLLIFYFILSINRLDTLLFVLFGVLVLYWNSVKVKSIKGGGA